jgi:hypothetical protein
VSADFERRVYVAGIPLGVLAADDRAVREIEDALRIAERYSDDLAVDFARTALGFALVHCRTAAERDRGHRLLAQLSEVFVRRGYVLRELPLVNVYLARERARRGDQGRPDQLGRRRHLVYPLDFTALLI